MKAVITDAALAHIRSISRYVSSDDARMGVRFVQAVRADVEFVLQWPKLSALARARGRERRNIRYRVMRPPFQNYLIFYRLEKNTVVIGAVLWGGMNWQEDLAMF